MAELVRRQKMKINPKLVGALIGALALGLAVWVGISLTGSPPPSSPLPEPQRLDLGPLKDPRFESLIMPRNYDLAGAADRLGRANPFAPLSTSTSTMKVASPASETPNSVSAYPNAASSSPAL